MIRLLGPTPADVLEVAAELTGTSVDALTGRSRSPSIVAARWAACGAMRLATTASFPQIGRAFGDRDHTTVMYGIERAMSTPRLKTAAETIAAAVRARCEGTENL